MSTAHAQHAPPPTDGAVDSPGQDITMVDDTTFAQQVLRADLPVVVEYTAQWCSPCRQMAPVIAEVAAAYAGRVQFVRIDTDDSPSTADSQGIRGVPTVQSFVAGKQVRRSQGARTKQELIEAAEEVLQASRAA